MFKNIKKLDEQILFEVQVKNLGDSYLKSRKRLRRILTQVDLTDFRKYRTQALLAQVNSEITALNKAARVWAKKNVPVTYVRGVDIAAKELKRMNVTRFVNTDAKIHQSAVASLVDDITINMVTANLSMKNEITRYIKKTQQRILEDKKISQLIVQGQIEGETRRQTSDVILKELTKQMGDEKYVRINGRRYQPDKYAELLARTRTREAASIGSINTALQYGLDLVQISVHNHPQEDPCSPFQGKVFSLSGNHPDFPALKARPPFHPNCKHVLIPITPEALEDDGIYEDVSKFSKGKGEVETFSEFEKRFETPGARN